MSAPLLDRLCAWYAAAPKGQLQVPPCRLGDRVVASTGSVFACLHADGEVPAWAPGVPTAPQAYAEALQQLAELPLPQPVRLLRVAPIAHWLALFAPDQAVSLWGEPFDSLLALQAVTTLPSPYLRASLVRLQARGREGPTVLFIDGTGWRFIVWPFPLSSPGAAERLPLWTGGHFEVAPAGAEVVASPEASTALTAVGA